jgi:hypothetical protein
MDPHEATGIMALVAVGAPDVFLHGNPQITIFEQNFKRTTHSQFTFNTIDFQVSDSQVFELSSLGASKFNTDLLGQCYIDIVASNVEDIHRLIESVKFSTKVDDKETFSETLTGEALYVLEGDQQSNKIEHETKKDGTTHVIVPIPFYFTKTADSYLPLVALYNTCISFECRTLQPVDRVQLLFQGVYLDTEERKKFASTPLEYIASTTESIKETIVAPQMENVLFAKSTIVLPFHKYTKDLKILIRSGDKDECVGLIDVVLNEKMTHISLNPLMARKIIPRRFYGIENEKMIYYVPFCHDPLARKICQTSQIHMGRLTKAQLDLFLRPGSYEISVVSSALESMRVQNGLFCNVY